MQEPLDITQNLRRKLVHDLTPCDRVDHFMEVLGMVPASPEVEDMEHRGSHIRLNRIGAIDAVMGQVSALAGDIAARCMLEHQGIDSTVEMVDPYMRVAMATTQSVVANLLEMGLIHLGGHS